MIDFQNSFTDTFSEKFAITKSLNIPPTTVFLHYLVKYQFKNHSNHMQNIFSGKKLFFSLKLNCLLFVTFPLAKIETHVGG